MVEDISAGCGVINFKVNRKLLVQVCQVFFSTEVKVTVLPASTVIIICSTTSVLENVGAIWKGGG